MSSFPLKHYFFPTSFGKKIYFLDWVINDPVVHPTSCLHQLPLYSPPSLWTIFPLPQAPCLCFLLKGPAWMFFNLVPFLSPRSSLSKAQDKKKLFQTVNCNHLHENHLGVLVKNENPQNPPHLLSQNLVGE